MAYFDGIQIGDRVWSFEFGYGKVEHIELNERNNNILAIKVKFKEKTAFYSVNGIRLVSVNQESFCNQTLFWDEIKFEIPKKPKIELKEDGYFIDLEFSEIIKSDGYNSCVRNGVYRDDKKTAERALRDIRRFARLLALRDQECENSRGFNNPRWGDNVYYIEYNREAYDGIENPYEVKSTMHRIPECAVLFKTKEDAELICNILNSGRFNLEGE